MFVQFVFADEKGVCEPDGNQHVTSSLGGVSEDVGVHEKMDEGIDTINGMYSEDSDGNQGLPISGGDTARPNYADKESADSQPCDLSKKWSKVSNHGDSKVDETKEIHTQPSDEHGQQSLVSN